MHFKRDDDAKNAVRPPLGNRKRTVALFRYFHGFSELQREFSIAMRFVVVDHPKNGGKSDRRRPGGQIAFLVAKNGTESFVLLPTP